jgi:hypothetical protein
MTTEDFNKKYSDYLETGHYGLDVENEAVINYLDDVFENKLIHIPNFKYSQIKTKFGYCRFYCKGVQVPHELINQIEEDINTILFNQAK